MSIELLAIYPPNPKTIRGFSAVISYDMKNDRIGYCNENSIFILSLEEENKQILQFSKHNCHVSSISFSRKGDMIASGDLQGNLKIWECPVLDNSYDMKKILKFQEFKKIIGEIKISTESIKSICWDENDSKIYVVGGVKNPFGCVIEISSLKILNMIIGHSSAINTIDIRLKEPKTIVTGGEDMMLMLYSQVSCDFIKSIKFKHFKPIKSVKFSPDFKFVISAGSDGNILIYDGNTFEFITQISNAHSQTVFDLCWFEDSKKFVSASADNTIKVWNVQTLKLIKEIKFESDQKTAKMQIGIKVTKNSILSISFDGQINFYGKNELNLFRTINRHQNFVTAFCLTNFLILGFLDGSIRIWDMKNFNLLSNSYTIGNIVSNHKCRITDIINIRNKIYSISDDNTLKVWMNNELIKTLDLYSFPKKIIHHLSYFIVLFEKKICLYSINFLLIFVFDLNFLSNDISSIPFSNEVLVTNTTSNTVEFLTISNDKIEISLIKKSIKFMNPLSIYVSPNGKFLVISNQVGMLKIFDIENAFFTNNKWQFHSCKILSGSWSSDSCFFAVSGLDCNIYIYSLSHDHKFIKTSLFHLHYIIKVGWINQNSEKNLKTLLTLGHDNVVKIWKISTKL